MQIDYHFDGIKLSKYYFYSRSPVYPRLTLSHTHPFLSPSFPEIIFKKYIHLHILDISIRVLYNFIIIILNYIFVKITHVSSPLDYTPRYRTIGWYRLVSLGRNCARAIVPNPMLRSSLTIFFFKWGRSSIILY